MFVCDRHTIYAWGHKDGFDSSMSHLRSYSVDLLVEDGMWQYLGHQYCIIGPSGQHNSIEELTTCCWNYVVSLIK
jgi:hypothetical protein